MSLTPNSRPDLGFTPLNTPYSRVVGNTLGKQTAPIIAAMGTCGDPRDPGYTSYRTDILMPTVEQYGLHKQWDVFNPEVTEWDPSMAAAEKHAMARSAVVLVPVTNQTEGHASTMETGFAVYGGARRGTAAIVSLEIDDKTPEQAVPGRILAKTALEKAQELWPAVVRVAPDVTAACQTAVVLLEEYQRRRTMGTSQYIRGHEIELMSPKKYQVEPAIYLSGTSGKQKPTWMQEVSGHLASFGAQADDSYRTRWDVAVDGADELVDKTTKAVQLIAITPETPSLGALAELGPRVMIGDLSGQSVGIYIAPSVGDPKSPANRARTLAAAHLDALTADFPRAPLFRAHSIEELALFGASELMRHRRAAENAV